MLSWLAYLTGQPAEQSQASTSKLAPPPAPLAPAPYAPATSESESDDEASSVLLIPMSAFAVGFVGGVYTSASRASLVFMAENAHRRPDTVQGWYFYNKTKNYKVLLAAVKGGSRTGLALGAWTSLFLGLERAGGTLRQRINVGLDHDTGAWMDGAVAGAGTALGASLLYQLRGQLARRCVLLGFVVGGVAGALKPLQAYVADLKQQSEGDEQKALNDAIEARRR